MIDAARSNPFRLRLFAYGLVLFAILRIAIGYLAVPVALLPVASAAFTVLFMVLPIGALFAGAGHRWDLKQAIPIVVLGVCVHLGSHDLVGRATGPAAAGIFRALEQVGLIVWCMGVGAALACLLKDRNMLLPIALFLALLDIWLVFAPEGFVSQALTGGRAPISLDAVAYRVPSIAVSGGPPEQAANGFARDLAYVGPADFLFLAMFFTALYRFGMRPRATLKAVAPILVAYLAVVLFLGDTFVGPFKLGALPALVPIGLTILWVNRREFKLLPDERLATWGIVVIGIPLVAWRIWATQPEPNPYPDWSPPFQTDEDLTKDYRF